MRRPRSTRCGAAVGLTRVTLELRTAGESHGPALVAIVSGLPAGLVLDRDAIDHDLAQAAARATAAARGSSSSRIEVEVLAGLRHGRTLGSPLALVIRNRDHENWAWGMSPWPPEGEPTGKGTTPVTLPRPGHADLAGVLKYGHDDTRDALERASARQTAVQVAAGAVAKALLREIGVEVAGRVLEIGGEATRGGMAAGDGRGARRPRHARRRRRGGGRRRSARPRLVRREGDEAGCAPRRGGDGDPGREGCRDRRRVRARTAAGDPRRTTRSAPTGAGRRIARAESKAVSRTASRSSSGRP